MNKTCKTCRRSKRLTTGFYKLAHMPDGHFNECKECWKARVIRNRTAKIDYYRAYDLARAKEPHRKASARKQTKVWRGRDQRRMKCHNAVARALLAGLIKKHPCARCDSVKAMAHHESYDHALDVIWLCQPCHKQRHKEMVAEGIEP
jgi:hypothetical protein